VWVIEEQDGGPVARRRTVRTGLRTGEMVEVSGGLASGDVVVQFGQTQLQDGAPVRVVSRGEEG
jgi:multidrug efflux pump subunit AcrA (membrane-fusion protein)